MTRRWLAWAAVLALAVSIGAGFFVLEGPGAARERRLDERRSQLLSEMARGVAVEREVRRDWPADPLATFARAEIAPAFAEAEWSYETEGATARLCLMLSRPDDAAHLRRAAPLFQEGEVVAEREDAPPSRLCYRLTDRRDAGEGR